MMREDWVVDKLKTLFKIETGNTPSKNEPLNYGSYIPFVKPPEIINKPIGIVSEYLSERGSKKARIAPKNSVLVTCIGNLGRVGINSKDMAFNQQVNAILDNSNIEPKFTFYQAQSPLFRTQLEKLSSATTVAIVNKGKFETINFKIAPLLEQKAIVAKIEQLFSELDKGIESLKTAQAKLKIYRQAVLKKAFEGELTNIQTINWVQINDIVKNVEYGTSSKSLNIGIVPVLRMGNIQNGKFDWNDLKYSSDEEEISKYKLNFNDVLFNRTNSPEHVGKTAIFKSRKTVIFAGYLIRINYLKDKINGDYLTYYLNSHTAKQYGNKVKSFGVNQSNINGTKLKTYPFPLCSLLEQNQIVQEIESRLSVCDNIEQTISDALIKAEALRQSILKKAFEGKLLHVKELEIIKSHPEYESAEKLLQRIKLERAK